MQTFHSFLQSPRLLLLLLCCSWLVLFFSRVKWIPEKAIRAERALFFYTFLTKKKLFGWHYYFKYRDKEKRLRERDRGVGREEIPFRFCMLCWEETVSRRVISSMPRLKDETPMLQRNMRKKYERLHCFPWRANTKVYTVPCHIGERKGYTTTS